MGETERNYLTERMSGGAFRASNALQGGFLKKMYENVRVHELRKNGLSAELQHPIYVFYDDKVAGEFFADIPVEGIAVVESKATNDHHDVFATLCRKRLNATGKGI